MSTQNLIGRSLAFAFILTLAGAASARRPLALVEAQEQAASVFATCEQSRAPETSGYRDMLARAQSPTPSTRAIAVAQLPSRKMGDHIVLVCPGGEIHQGSGYRDFPVRMQTEPSGAQIASVPRLVGRR
jgi:hypothetical protein